MFTVNFDKIGKELFAAKESEEKYRRENNAKFRAVEQKVATYDEFRDIVLTSHLKPLDKEDKSNGKLNNWNVLANSSIDLHNYSEDAHCRDVTQIMGEAPENPVDFFSTWRKLKCQASLRYNFLTNYEPTFLKKVFVTEINPEVLGDMMTLLDSNYREEDAQKIYGLLNIIHLLKRFKLSKELLTKVEKSATKSLLLKLKANLRQEDIMPLIEIFH